MPETTEPGIFEIMYSTRAMRRLKPDPIPEETLKKIVDAGIRCASGGNMQDWAFIIVQDTERKRFIRDYYWNTWQTMRGSGNLNYDDIPAPQQRMLNAVAHLAAHMDEAPALLLACTRDHYPPIASMGNERASKIVIYGSIFPAVQNILLACRALGVGATLTTIHCLFEDKLKE
jgi:nitroreductase